MNMRCPQTVIIGSGLSGLLISRALAAARVDHILVGGPPDSAPRLGESLSLEASVFAFDFLEEFLPYFLSKHAVVGFIGEQVFACDLRIDRARLFFRLLGYRSPSALFHVDRIGLDAALYQSVVANSFCEHTDARVVDLRYDPGSDRVAAIHLDDGACLRPGIVFDATNHVRLVARAVGVPCRMLSGLQRVVHTHYRRFPAVSAICALIVSVKVSTLAKKPFVHGERELFRIEEAPQRLQVPVLQGGLSP